MTKVEEFNEPWEYRAPPLVLNLVARDPLKIKDVIRIIKRKALPEVQTLHPDPEVQSIAETVKDWIDEAVRTAWIGTLCHARRSLVGRPRQRFNLPS